MCVLPWPPGHHGLPGFLLPPSSFPPSPPILLFSLPPALTVEVLSVLCLLFPLPFSQALILTTPILTSPALTALRTPDVSLHLSLGTCTCTPGNMCQNRPKRNLPNKPSSTQSTPIPVQGSSVFQEPEPKALESATTPSSSQCLHPTVICWLRLQNRSRIRPHLTAIFAVPLPQILRSFSGATAATSPWSRLLSLPADSLTDLAHNTDASWVI